MRPSLALCRRFLSSSPPPAAAAIPRLKLYTGGPACSLCTDLKEELLALQHAQPSGAALSPSPSSSSGSDGAPSAKQFELETYDIRKAEADGPSEAAERKQWRRLYKYDIPVLHLVRPGLGSTNAAMMTTAKETPFPPGARLDADEVEIFRHRLNLPKLESALAVERVRLESLPGSQTTP
jgi:hypothetical protein